MKTSNDHFISGLHRDETLQEIYLSSGCGVTKESGSGESPYLFYTFLSFDESITKIYNELGQYVLLVTDNARINISYLKRQGRFQFISQ